MTTKEKDTEVQVKSTREAFGKALVEFGRENSNIVAIDADLSCSTQTQIFAKEFPERFFNAGISEQDAMGMAAGLSTCGKIPFVATFAIFATGRAWDQIRNGICYPNFNVKIVGTHGGITVGEDGATHQSLEDISLMRSIPNMTVLVPSDAVEVRAAVKFAIEHNGPVYIRISRTSLPTLFNGENYRLEYGKAQLLRSGWNITLVSNGETLIEAFKCSELLKTKGITADILNYPFIKPFDKEALLKSALKTKRVLVIENHSKIGGLGSAVCECLSENMPTLVKRIGTDDVFGQSGQYQELMSKYGLVAEKFVSEALKLIETK